MFLFVSVNYAQVLTLHDCYKKAFENAPLASSEEEISRKADLQQKVTATNYLPSFALTAQATYQSDVTSLDVEMPSIPGIGQLSLDIPEPAKDQYKIAFEFSQFIWDGGITKSLKELNNVNARMEKQQLKVSRFSVFDKVNTYYFSVLIIDKNLDLIEHTTDLLNKRMHSIQTAIENGVAISSDLRQMEAEVLRLNQKKVELQAARQYSLESLSTLTKTQISGVDYHSEVQDAGLESDSILRPEIELLSKQQEVLQANSNILKKSLMPKVVGFGQVGYGRPGFNMLSNEFDSFYYVGAKLSWDLWDWGEVKKQQEILSIQGSILDNQKDQILQDLDLLIDQRKSSIDRINKQLQNDKKIVELYKKILDASSSKLDNGVITTTDYLSDVYKLYQAQIDMENRNIQKMKLNAELQIVTGSIMNNINI